MRRRFPSIPMRAVPILMLLLVAPFPVTAQQEFPREPELVHWAFSSVFGTGWYRLANNRSAFVLRIPVRWTTREAGFDEHDKRRFGMDWHLPFTVGYHRLEEAGDFLAEEDYSTLSVTPGIEIEIPLNRVLSLRPFVKAGLGVQSGRDEDSWIWSTGMKSRLRLPMARSWDLLANAYWAGFRQVNGDGGDDIAGWLIGVEHSHGLGDTSFDANWHFSWTGLSPPLEYVESGKTLERNDLNGFFALGFAISPRDGPWDFWLYRPHQLGFALEIDPRGDYFAIKFNSRSWFTQ